MARTLIISDTHMGDPESAVRTAAMLQPLWRQVDHLVINGDVAEVHHPKVRIQAAEATLELYSLCERDGVQLTLLSGNHDPFISDLRYLSLAAGQVFVTHGDVLHPAIAPWSHSARELRHQMDIALKRLDPASRNQLHARLEAAQHASHMDWLFVGDRPAKLTIFKLLFRPFTVATLLHYWWTVPRMACQFLEEHAPEARFMVLGHTHRQGIWRFDQRVVLNTGSFNFPARPRGVLVEEDCLSVWPIVRRDGAYHLGRRPIAEFALMPDAAQSLRLRMPA